MQEILAESLNRLLLLQKILEIVSFDMQQVLDDINRELQILEDTPIQNPHIVEFIKNNYQKYLFFTNTSLPRSSLENILNNLEIADFFEKCFTGDDGTKVENTYHIIDEYNLSRTDILFIDDTLRHIENISQTGVNTLHFSHPNMEIKI